jgi:hypothetical protein
MIEFKVTSIGKAEAWCMKHVGPRLYYIHDKIGGEGWRIMRTRSSETLLCLEDDKKATMAMLMLVE